MELIIGTRRWSSWSLRPWLVAKRAKLDVVETLVQLREAEATEASIRAAGSPSGLVPVLKDGAVVVWDSLAICEYLAEVAPSAQLWPADVSRRAQARAAVAEMHAGFSALRAECPMDLLRPHGPVALSEAAQRDVRRMVALWRALRSLAAADGPYLLGGWSIADAFFTPVATRFSTYEIDLAAAGDDGLAGDYVSTLLADADFLAWRAAAAQES